MRQQKLCQSQNFIKQSFNWFRPICAPNLNDLKTFTGIDSPYEAPLAPEVHLQVGMLDAQGCLLQLYPYIK